MTVRQPVLFISHGAPSMVLEDEPVTRFLKQLGQELPRPKAIVCISAHWETLQPSVGTHPRPSTIHDFYGFAEDLYRLRYPAPGASETAEQVRQLLLDNGHHAVAEPQRGLDHGAWAPLMLMFPAADIPVTQLSVQPGASPEHHFALGQAIAALGDQGVLIIASGSATHNLRDFGVYSRDAAPADYALAFDAWLNAAIIAGDNQALFDYLRLGPEARRNHPTPEHLLPLFVALGAAGSGQPGRRIHSSFSYGFLSMACFGWGMHDADKP